MCLIKHKVQGNSVKFKLASLFVCTVSFFIFVLVRYKRSWWWMKKGVYTVASGNDCTWLCYAAYVDVNVGRSGDLCCPGPVWFVSCYGFQRYNLCGVVCESAGNRQQFSHSHDSTSCPDTVRSWPSSHLCGHHDWAGHGCLRFTGKLSWNINCLYSYEFITFAMLVDKG